MTTFSLWDGWDLVEEYQGATTTAAYVYGATGLIAGALNGQLYYFYQDGSGSTSHLADSNGVLMEWYRYDLHGTPFFYDANDQQITNSAFGVRHLFTGQQWDWEIYLYDLRNRFYSPDIGRFLQPDPVGFDGDATNLYRYAENNPVTSSDPTGLDAVPHSGGYYTYIAYWPWNRLVGWHVVNGSRAWLQCAGAARFLGGGYMKGVYYNMPEVDYWRQGATLSRATPPGTIVATGWVGGRYPSAPVSAYTDPNSPLYGQTINHALVFEYIDKEGRYHLFSQNPNGPIYETIVPADQASQYSEVRVDKSNGPYETTPSDRSVTSGNGASSDTGINTRVPSIIGGIFYPYGFGNRSPSLNFGEGRAGTMLGAFSWSTNDAFLTGVLNWGDVGRDMYANSIGAMEPGLGCFVAGTPVLMADGSEKPIESIEVGDSVLAWNEETKQTFSTKVLKALHPEEKVQTLFDIELGDGRKFTVNNDHPIYIVEDGGFTFSDELAARFAKGEAITFQNSKSQPVRIAALRMRRESCGVYNLEVEGRDKNGHTYYASGILVHNAGARNRFK
jgi:RHS repeat-associated protein